MGQGVFLSHYPLPKVVCAVISLLLLPAFPSCRLGEALGLLSGAGFRLCFPGDGPFCPGETIVVLSDLAEEPFGEIPGLPAGTPALFSAQSGASARFVRREGLLPVDCGLSLRDTLTLSSVTESSAMISLQRPLERLDGGMVEPVEIPLTLTRRWSPFHLLCCGGALLLAGGAGALEQAGIF